MGQEKERTEELLDTVSLGDVAKKKIRRYSGSMKQCLGIEVNPSSERKV